MKLIDLFESEDALNEHLKKVDGKWALVSKTTGRVLRYYKGEGKPGKEWVSKMEQQIHAFESISLFESTITLHDLYDDHELHDESEQLYHWIDDEDLERNFQVKEMSADQAKTLKTARNDTTVFDAFNNHATKEQKRLVQSKAKQYDFNRIIVIAGNTVVDGNHQVVASILSNHLLKYIDLYE